MKLIFGISKKYWAEKALEGGHEPSTRMGRVLPPGRTPTLWAPCQASGAHLLLYEGFYPGTNQRQAYGMKLRRHEAEPI